MPNPLSPKGDTFVFDAAAFGAAVTPTGVNFVEVAAGADYDGTNATDQAAFVFEVDADGDSGSLYYDSDSVDTGYTVIASLEHGQVNESDINIV